MVGAHGPQIHRGARRAGDGLEVTLAVHEEDVAPVGGELEAPEGNARHHRPG